MNNKTPHSNLNFSNAITQLSQPIHSPLYKLPPYHYSNVEMFQVLFSISLDTVKEILPPELEPAKRLRASVTFAKYPSINNLDPYCECFFSVLALFKNKPIIYCPFAWVDSDEALCAGREIWGFPKKLAQIEISYDGANINGKVLRKGNNIIEASINLSDHGKLQYIMFEDIVIEKIIPNVKGDGSVRQLNRVRLQNYLLTELRGGPAKLTVNGSEYDWINIIRPEKIITGNYGRGKMTLPFGKPLYD